MFKRTHWEAASTFQVLCALHCLRCHLLGLAVFFKKYKLYTQKLLQRDSVEPCLASDIIYYNLLWFFLDLTLCLHSCHIRHLLLGSRNGVLKLFQGPVVNRLEPATKEQECSGPGDPVIAAALLTSGDLLMQAFVIFPISLIFTCIFVAKLVGFHSALRKGRTQPVVLTIVLGLSLLQTVLLHAWCSCGLTAGLEPRLTLWRMCAGHHGDTLR